MKYGLGSNRLRAVGAALACLGAGGGAAAADGFEPVTPYRPSVSSPAQLSAPGQLELEFGGLQQRSDAGRRTSLPYLLKLAFNADWGLLIGGEGHVWLHDDSGRVQGLGDTTATLKRAWSVADETALGMELAVKVPTANDAIGSGKTDWSLNGIYSQDFGSLHLDANLNALRLGAAESGSSRTQLGASASFSRALSGHWGVTGEVSGTRRSGAPSGAQLLAAVTYSPTKFLTVDVGVARAVRPVPATTQWFTGVVLPLARWW